MCIGAGSAVFVIVLALLGPLLEILPEGWLALLIPMVIMAYAVAACPKPWGAVAGILLGVAGAFALAAAGILWPVSEACREAGVICDRPSSTLIVLIAAAATVPGAVLGATAAMLARHLWGQGTSA